MDKLFNNILASHEREDNAMFLSKDALLHAVRCEFSNAETLICQAQEKGFSVSEFFSGKELPADMELPVRKTQSFYVKKHTAVQQPYMLYAGLLQKGCSAKLHIFNGMWHDFMYMFPWLKESKVAWREIFSFLLKN